MYRNLLNIVNRVKPHTFSNVKPNFNRTEISCRTYSMVSLPENGPNPYIKRDNESITDMKARLLYQSRKRGMLENGLILSTFAGKHLHKFDKERLHLYDQLINKPSNDWDLFYWATGVKDTPKEFENEVMELLKRHVKNELKETRFTQPDLNQTL